MQAVQLSPEIQYVVDRKDNHQRKVGKPTASPSREGSSSRRERASAWNTTGVLEQGMHQRVTRELGRASCLLANKNGERSAGKKETWR